MGKRKSAKPMKTKVRQKLNTTFDCLFCNHENSITVKLDKKEGLGWLKCSRCPKKFATKLGELDAGVDIYFKWVDACDAANRDVTESEARLREPSPPPSTLRTRTTTTKVVKVARTSLSERRVGRVESGRRDHDRNTGRDARAGMVDERYSDDEAGYSSSSLPDLDDLDRAGAASSKAAAPKRRLLRRGGRANADVDDDYDVDMKSPIEDSKTVADGDLSPI